MGRGYSEYNDFDNKLDYNFDYLIISILILYLLMILSGLERGLSIIY